MTSQRNVYAPPSARVEDVEPSDSGRRPVQVVVALGLFWASLAVGMIAMLSNSALMAGFRQLNGAQMVTAAVIFLGFLLVMGAVSYHVALGRNWARLTILVITLLAMSRNLPAIFVLIKLKLVWFALTSVTQLVMQAAALGLLFFSKGRSWYAR